MSLLTDDALTQLAFSVYGNKGVFAVLLGSGISRSADIPTGWEITLDLVRRIALAQDEEEQPDWAKWHRDRTGEEPNYSSLLLELGLSPEERRSILHTYIEPNDEDRQEGRKVPTAAHFAVADLVQAGYIKIIVTTNFDRLMENALRERGVEPTIVSSTDALSGAEPIAHSTCYLLKLHGNYKDARIRNTDDELSKYPKAFDRLLDRILDEYGLIIAGWSGEWDQALRAAMLRAPNRRYAVYWATRSALRPIAQELADHRRAHIIKISDADLFFKSLKERIGTLQQTHRKNPLSTELLVGTAKRYLAKPEHRIQLDDLFAGEVHRLLAAISVPELDAQREWSQAELRTRVQLYQNATEPLARMVGVLGRWGDDSEFPLISDTIRALYTHAEKAGAGLGYWLGLRSYPAVLVFFAYGLALTRAQRWRVLHRFLSEELTRENGRRVRLIDCLYLWHWKGGTDDLWKKMPDLERRRTPLSDHLFNLFSQWSESFAPLTPDFELLYERFEMLAALTGLEATPEQALRERLAQGGGTALIVVGRIGWDYSMRERLLEELKADSVKAPLIQAGFGRGSETFIELFTQNFVKLAGVQAW